MTTTKNLWTAILLWMALFSFTLSAQVTTIDLSNSEDLTNDSYIISTAGTYHFKGTYSGTPTAVIQISGSALLRTAVINVEAEGDVTIILENVNISLRETGQCPLSARNANGTVTVQLKGENTLATTNTSEDSSQCPALWAPETPAGKLIIEEGTGSTGSLEATGASWAPGIGSRIEESQIEIKSGTIIANGGTNAAGIGGGYNGAGGTITISGGTVTATGGEFGAGIGGGYNGAGGTITISGGTVTAKSGYRYNVGIGGGQNGAGGTITISGGEVTVTKGVWTQWHIGGNGANLVVVGPDAIVKAKDIYGNPESVNYSEYTNGFIFSGGKATVQGDAKLSADITIKNSEELTIPTNASLTIEEGVTLTNNGTIKNEGEINGSVSGNGTIRTKLSASIIDIEPVTYTGSAVTPTVTVRSFSDNYCINTDYEVTYENNINAGTATVTVTPTDSINGNLYGNAVSKDFTIQKATPKADHFTFTAPTDLTYNGQAKAATVQANNTIIGMGTVTIKYYGADSNECQPINVGTYTVQISVTEGTNFTADSSEITADSWTFTIAKAPSTIEPFTTIANKTYNGEAIIIDAPVVTGAGLANDVTATLAYKKENAADDTYSADAPLHAGNYTVKASYPGDDNHLAATDVTTNFQIIQATDNGWTTPLPTTVTTFQYGEDGYPTAVAKYGEVVYTYYSKAEDSEAYTPLDNKPTALGTWYVKTYVEETDDYNEVPESDDYTPFTIIAKTLTEDMATLSPTEYTYDGNKPTITVKQGETILVENTDYTVTWPDDPTGVGTHTVTITGQGNYQGTQTKSFSITPADATLSFAEPTLTITQGDAVPANALTNPYDCEVTYSSDNEAVATVDVATGVVTVVGVGTATITATAGGNYTGSASYTLTVNRYIPPYIPPTDPVYYTVTIPTEVKGAIIHGGGTQTVEEYNYCSFRIELDPNGSGEYPTVTKGSWWDTLTPDGEGNYSFMVTGDTEISISEVPTSSYSYYRLTFSPDSVAESETTYWSGAYIEVTGASQLHAEAVELLGYTAPFGTTVTLRPIETERRKFLQWEDGSTKRERTLTLWGDEEINALWQKVSPSGIGTIATNSIIRGERGQLYIEVPNACKAVVYNYNGVPLRVAHLTAGTNHIHGFNSGLYLVKLGDARAVPVRVR
ncbi:MAG: Ig-like domain-containing protein [Parabacteroides sp.]